MKINVPAVVAVASLAIVAFIILPTWMPLSARAQAIHAQCDAKRARGEKVQNDCGDAAGAAVLRQALGI